MVEMQAFFLNFLLECGGIASQHTEVKKNNYKCYNIYQLLNVTNKEVQMCRILADLLDPDGAHGEGIKYLSEFFKVIFFKDISDSVLQNAKVYREYPIANRRRMDIVIEYPGGFIPIEVKINAEDMKSQCYDYFHFAKEKDPDTCVVYLTRNGYKPSEYSLSGENGERLKEKDIRCISFDRDILNWLDNIKHLANDNMVPLLEQFEGAVKDFLNSEEIEYRMQLSEKIISSSNNLRTSIEIANTLNFAKAELMKRLFEEFENQMEPLAKRYRLKLEKKSRWFHYTDQATVDFYAQKNSTYPGLNYVVSSIDLEDELSLWFRIEIEDQIYGCFCVFDYAAKPQYGYEIGNECAEISDTLWSKLREHIVLPEEKRNEGWYILWKYLPTGEDNPCDNDEIIPDFKKMNDAAIELADDEKRKEFVTRSIKVIEDKLLSLIKS